MQEKRKKLLKGGTTGDKLEDHFFGYVDKIKDFLDNAE
jgi:hypothetical protein